MKTHVVAGATAAVLVLSLLGCKEREQTSTTRTTSGPMATEVQPQTEHRTSATEKPVLTSEDKDFITKQALERREEVAAGMAIQRKAASADVKALGERMVTDNSHALDELKSIADKKGLMLPTELDKDRQAEIDKLAKLSGKKLDKHYANEMVDEREEDVKDLRDAAQKVTDPDLKSWAAAKLPLFENELTTARDIKAKTKKE